MTTGAQVKAGSISTAPARRARFQLALVLAVTVLIRLPFLNQAFQLDDPNYLAGAQYVQHDPAHPLRTTFVFVGDRVNMRGHPHPPLDIWILGAVLAVVGSVREVPFHAAYIAFSLIAAAAAWSLARRFTPRPLPATLLFLATPAFVVHGNALEADVPHLAFWVAGTAAFVLGVDRGSKRWLAVAGACLAVAALAAYQAVVLAPVLLVYLWTQRKWPRGAIAAACVPIVTVAAYQLYERIADGALPAAVMMGHFQAYGFQRFANKAKSALALTGHAGWLIFPLLAVAAFLPRLGRRWWLGIAALTAAAAFVDPNPLFWASFAAGLAVLAACVRGLRDPDRDRGFLSAWVLLFFAAAVVIFFAGSARYLLPIAFPAAALATRALDKRPRWLMLGFAAQFAFSMALAQSHYEHSDAYREFVRSLAPRLAGRTVWVNGEWGLRWYAEQAGAKPLLKAQEVKPGEIVISNRLGYPVPFTTPGGEMRTISETAVVPSVPLRLIALTGGSGFSTIERGVRPFGISFGPADVLRADIVQPRAILREYLSMNDPEARNQLGGGVYDLEAERWRWTAARATVLLKRPDVPSRLEANIFVPPNAAARRVALLLDGAEVATLNVSGGGYIIVSGPLPPGSGTANVSITVDKTFSPPGDNRVLGVILNDIGFRR